MDRSILNGVRNVCPGQRCIRFVSVLSDVFPIVLLQLLHGQKTLCSSAVFLAFAAVSRTVFCCPSTAYSTCYPLFFCSEAAKRQNTKKRIYSSNNRGSGKVETADSPWNFGQIFPTDRLWKVSGKVESFFRTGKVESLWSGKQKFVEKIVENLLHSKYRFHKLWKIHSTAFYHRFHKPASAAVKCCGHSRHFFCTWIFNRLLKRMWKTCRRRWNSCGIGKKALQNPVFHMFCSVLSQFSMRGFCCGYF